MTEDRKMKMRAAQRQMLRKIVGTRRRVTKGVYANSESSSSGSVFSGESVELEPWIEFLQRATHRADEYAKLYSVRNWVTTHYRYKLRLAGHMGRRTDDRWSRKVLIGYLQTAHEHGDTLASVGLTSWTVSSRKHTD